MSFRKSFCFFSFYLRNFVFVSNTNRILFHGLGHCTAFLVVLYHFLYPFQPHSGSFPRRPRDFHLFRILCLRRCRWRRRRGFGSSSGRCPTGLFRLRGPLQSRFARQLPQRGSLSLQSRFARQLPQRGSLSLQSRFARQLPQRGSLVALRQHEKSLSGSFDRLKPARDIFPRRLVYCFMWLSAPLFLPERPGAFLLLALLGCILFSFLLYPGFKHIIRA